MSTEQALANARSFRRGTLDQAALLDMAKLCGAKDLVEMAEAMGDYDGDAFLVEGDLIVDGNFRTSDVEAIWLVVRGNVIVSGLYEDTCNDAPDFVWIGGNLQAADVLTAGRLVVKGDVRVTNCLVGDYNDGRCDITGNVDAKLFAMFDHTCRIKGENHATYQVADSRSDEIPAGQTRWADLPFAAAIEPDDLKTRLRQHLPVLRH